MKSKLIMFLGTVFVVIVVFLGIFIAEAAKKVDVRVVENGMFLLFGILIGGMAIGIIWRLSEVIRANMQVSLYAPGSEKAAPVVHKHYQTPPAQMPMPQQFVAGPMASYSPQQQWPQQYQQPYQQQPQWQQGPPPNLGGWEQ